MKVFAVNSSARLGIGSKTELVLDHLVEGMKAEGAEVEVAEIYKKKINYCIGCYSCWTKTPGKCIHQDDMSHALFDKYIAADLVVLATPLYHGTLNANMKAFIERMLPSALPFFELRDGRTSHPLRVVPQPVVAVSVAGFPEYSAFSQLSAYLNHLYKKRLAAEIYIPDSGNISKSAKNLKMKTLLEAVVQGGKELVKNGNISEKTMADINTPARSFQKMAPVGNIYWKTCIDEGVTPEEFDERKLVPRPDSIETFLSIMTITFNPEKAEDFTGIYQFMFTGDVEGDCFLEIKNGIFSSGSGAAANPDVTIKTPFGVWMDIVTKKADGQQMLMEKKYDVEGDIACLMKIRDIFS